MLGRRQKAQNFAGVVRKSSERTRSDRQGGRENLPARVHVDGFAPVRRTRDVRLENVPAPRCPTASMLNAGLAPSVDEGRSGLDDGVFGEHRVAECLRRPTCTRGLIIHSAARRPCLCDFRHMWVNRGLRSFRA